MPGAGELRVLRRRIRSVRSTQKITRSFELIAASRIGRARRAVEAARPYAALVARVIRDLGTETEATRDPLLAERATTRRVGVLVITSDRGLAGAYNSNVLRRAERLVRNEREQGREVVLFAVGRKAEAFFRYRQLPPARAWQGISDQPSYQNAQDVGKELTAAYTSGAIDKLWMIYTDFRSALTQVASTVQLLPVEVESVQGGQAFPPAFEFEPDPAAILSQLLPRYLDQRIFAGLLESAASEHASRQRAMKAATDNAGDIIEDLTREANQARQSAITTEMLEIVGGAEALGGTS